MWLDYLHASFPDDNFVIEKLNSKGDYSSFKIGAPIKLLEELSLGEFWPKGVHVRRFNFFGNRRITRMPPA